MERTLAARNPIWTRLSGWWRVVIVRVVYSDESGLGGDLDKEPITVVAAVLFDMDSQWYPVELDLSEAISRIPRKLLFKRCELKGQLLLKAITKKRDADATAAERGLTEVLSLVPKHRLYIFHGAVDRKGYVL
jgi:hypothetical protein